MLMARPLNGGSKLSPGECRDVQSGRSGALVQRQPKVAINANV